MELSERRPGGIISLAAFAEEHAEALNYDLLTKTQYTLDDVGGSLSWGAFRSFIHFLDTGSALARDLNKSTGWETSLTTNVILADLYDLLQVIHEDLRTLGGHKSRKIKPYPRPGRDEDNKRKIGKGAMPLDQLREWLRRDRHGKRK